MILRADIGRAIVEIDLRNLYYVLLDGKLLKLATMEIVDPIYDEVHFIMGGHHDIEPITRSYANYVHINNGQYEYLDLRDGICYGSKLVERYFLSHFTNDFIWDLYQSYFKQYLQGKRYCDVSTYCNHITQVIDGISLYNIEEIL